MSLKANYTDYGCEFRGLDESFILLLPYWKHFLFLSW